MTTAWINRRLFTAGGAVAIAGAHPALSEPRAVLDGEVRYLDPRGDDDADGRSPGSAWRSMAALAALDPEMSCELRLRRGGVWKETIRAPSRRLVIKAFGSGAEPIIDLGRPLGPVRKIALMRGGTLWTAESATAPRQLLAYGWHLRRVAPGQVERLGQWYWADGAVLVATASSDSPPELLAVTAERGIDGRGHEVLSISNVAVRHAVYGADADDAKSCWINDTTFHGCFLNGIRASASIPRHRLTIRNNLFTETAGTAIAFGGRIAEVAVLGNEIRDVALIPGAAETPSLAWTAAIKNWGWGKAGWQGRVVISGNDILASGPRDTIDARPEHGHGIWIDEVVEPLERHSVAFNRTARCASRGIYVEKSDDVDVDYNQLHDCARTRGTGALALQANKYGYDVEADAPAFVTGQCRRNRLRHNSVAGGDLTLEVVAEDSGCDLSDNLVQDNVLTSLGPYDVAGAAIVCRGGGANDGRHGTGNRYQSNCLGPPAGRTLGWDGVVTAFAARIAEMSGNAFDANLEGNPRFVNAAAGDLRLHADSLCLDRAMAAPRPHDLAGRAVPHGLRADLGCHEGPAPTSTAETED